MKNIIILLAFALLGSPGWLPAENILLNPSFESVESQNSALPLNWKTMQRLSLARHHFVDETVASDGQKSVRLENENPDVGVNNYVLFIQSDLAARLNKYPANTKMQLSAMVRTDSADTRFRFYLEGTISDGTSKNFILPIQGTPSRNWTRVVHNFQMPSDKTFNSCYVCLQLVSTNKVWFDEVYLGPATNHPDAEKINSKNTANLIENASIEELDETNSSALSWKKFQIDLVGDFQSVDNTFAKTGMNSLKISCEDPALSSQNFLMWQQNGLAEKIKVFPPGTAMEIKLWANTASNPSVKFRFYLELRSDKKFIGTFISPPQTADVGWQPFSLSFTMPEEVPSSAYLCLQLLNHGSVWFDDIFLGKAEDKPAKAPATAITEKEESFCRVTNFPPQQSFFLPEKPGKLLLEYTLTEADLGVLQIQLATAATKLLQNYEFPVAKTNGILELELPELAAGTYTLTYSAKKMLATDYFRILHPYEKGVRFDEKRICYLNGKRFFPLMVMTPEMSEDALNIYQQAGFNSIAFNGLTTNQKSAKYLASTAQKYGLAVVDWANLGDYHRSTPEENRTALIKRVEIARSLDNFIGWLDDESEMRLVPLARMTDIYKNMFELAPEYVIWQNHAPRLTAKSGPYGTYTNVKRYSHICDVSGLDIYPVPEGGGHSNLDNRTISCVGEYTDLVLSTVYGQKPIWMVLQTSGWSEEGGRQLNQAKPRPDYEQFRFMCFNALTHGATGLVFYGPGSLGRDIRSPYMGTLADVNYEIKALESFITAGEKQELIAASAGQDVKIIQYELKGEYAVIVANESKKEHHITLELPGKKAYYHLPDGKEFNRSEKLSLSANAVIVITTIQQKIPKHGAFKALTKLKNNDDIKKTGGAIQETLWKGQWTAHPKFVRAEYRSTFAKQDLRLEEKPEKAVFRICGDDAFKLYINDKKVGEGYNCKIAQQYDVKRFLKQGENIFFIELINHASVGGLLFEGEINTAKQNISFVSGEKTLFSENGKSDWTAPHLAGSPPTSPWGPINLIIFNP